MHGGGTFEILIYLLAGVVSVPIAKRLGLGSVLGYLIAGVVIGPSCLKLIGESSSAAAIAEFGVIMMLFLIGLELQPALLWRLRSSIFGMGTAQVVGTAFLFMLVSLAFGLSWKTGLAIGLILAMSSTAIVLQSLNERGLAKNAGGQASFSVLLFQDLAVIPILAVLPLLALAPAMESTPPATSHGGHGTAHSVQVWVETLPSWGKPLAVIGAVAIVFFAGRYLLRPVFRLIAETRLREIFTATALLLVLGVTMLMQAVNLSPALGAFLGGVVLADSEYRHQLEADIEPFKGLLLGLFFISVGADLEFSILLSQPLLVLGLLAILILVKMAVLGATAMIFQLEKSQAYLFAFALAQGGEFAFVLFSQAAGQQVLTPEVIGPLTTVVALSMAVSPLLLLSYEKLVLPRLVKKKNEREPDAIESADTPVILAGFGRFGHIVGRFLNANGFGTTVLDSDPDQVDTLRKFGLRSFYGDASRNDLLHAAGADQAQIFALAIDDEERSLEIVELVKKEYPHLKIYARATSRAHAYEFLKRGVEYVYRDTLSSALDMGVDLLRALGMGGHQAVRSARIFKAYDEKSMRELAKVWDDDAEYISQARQHIKNLEEILQRDTSQPGRATNDSGWERPSGESKAD